MRKYHACNAHLQAADYLPHNVPMVLLADVLSLDDTHVDCQVEVSAMGVLSPFLDAQGCLPAWYALEMMAQTIGVWSGWHGVQKGQTPQLGMLLGARTLKCERPVFMPGEVLHTAAQLILQDAHIGSFECQIFSGLQLLVSARLNTYQPAADALAKLLNIKEDE